MLSRFHTIPACYGQTDGRTDGQTDGQTELLYRYRASVCWRAIMIEEQLSYHRTNQLHKANMSGQFNMSVTATRQYPQNSICQYVFQSYVQYRLTQHRRLQSRDPDQFSLRFTSLILTQEIRSVEHGYLSLCFKSRTRDLGHAPFGVIHRPSSLCSTCHGLSNKETIRRMAIANWPCVSWVARTPLGTSR